MKITAFPICLVMAFLGEAGGAFAAESVKTQIIPDFAPRPIPAFPTGPAGNRRTASLIFQSHPAALDHPVNEEGQ